MEARYTDGARHVLHLAREAVRVCGDSHIGTEYLLLGLVEHGVGLSASLLIRSGATLPAVAAALVDLPRSTSGPALQNEWRFTPRAARAMTVAGLVATEFRLSEISTDCILVGLLRDPSCGASRVAVACGISPSRLVNDISTVMLGRPDSHRPGLPESVRVRIRPSGRTWREGGHSRRSADSLSEHNISLESLIAMVTELDASRIVWPDDLNREARYDVDAEIGEHEGDPGLYRVVLAALERQLRLLISVETEKRPVYVLTCTEGAIPGRRLTPGSGSFMVLAGISIGDLSPADLIRRRAWVRKTPRQSDFGILTELSGDLDMPTLCRELATHIGVPFLDKTLLDGTYEIRVQSSGKTLEAFLSALERQAGLIATREEEQVEIVLISRVGR